MKIRFPIWLACVLATSFAVLPAADAQNRRDPKTRPEARPEKRPEVRPTAPANKPGLTDREKERLREAEESRRAKDRARDPHGPGVHHRPRDLRDRELHEALLRRERILQERRAAERRDIARWHRLRAERAEARRRATYARWGMAVSTPAGRAEFELYSKRKARLNRIRDIAAQRNDTVLIKRTDHVIALENTRHANVLTVLVAAQR